ncbi:MAG: hypothetical protein K2W96_00315, partial [Gemmataceae bacterium]|nr:hypothetical protein [Gemmataceae bacterium]
LARIGTLNRSRILRDRRLSDRLRLNRSLSRRDLGRLRLLGRRDSFWRFYWRRALTRLWFNRFITGWPGLVRPGYPAFIPVYPDAGGLSLSGGGISVDGGDVIDPEQPAIVYPGPGGGVDGGIIANIDPEGVPDVPLEGDPATEEPTIPGPEVPEPEEPGEEPPPSGEDGDVEGASVDAIPLPADSVLQTTRKVRFANTTKKKVKVKFFYETVTEDDKLDWPTGEPAKGGTPVELDLEPGEVAEVKEGDWTVNASRISFTAQTEDGSKKWEQFKDQEMDLVPEDTEGVKGYAAPAIQTLTLSFK